MFGSVKLLSFHRVYKRCLTLEREFQTSPGRQMLLNSAWPWSLASGCSSGHHRGAAENKARCVSMSGWLGKSYYFCPVSGLRPVRSWGTLYWFTLFCLQELASLDKWLCASGVYWNCVIYNYITNGCFGTDTVNYLVYDKWSLCAVILSGMKLDYFNIGKWRAVLSFNFVKLSPVAYLRCYMVFMGNQSLSVFSFFQ